MRVWEWLKCLEYAKEHYPVSDDYIKNYQQDPHNKNGYMYYAWQIGHPICCEIVEPNQRWHFFESYIAVNVMSYGPGYLEGEASKVYNDLKCPELILWIAEASGVCEETVREAANVAKQIIDNKGHRNKAAAAIRRMIPWQRIENTQKGQE